MLDGNLLVRWFGFPATLIHGDLLVLDRWNCLKKRLPRTKNGEKLIDIGCGTGAFSIGAALRGYEALGLSWDERNQRVAAQRAALCKAPLASFQVMDVRALDTRRDLVGRFDVVVSCENIEHIIDDRKLMRDMAACLKPGGRLLLTTPYYHYRAITAGDNGPFCTQETGWHVRRGYTRDMLEGLCAQAGLVPDEFFFCSGILSQKFTGLFRVLSGAHLWLAWGVVLPLRIFPPLLDPFLTRFFRWPYFTIGMTAHKP